MCQSTHQILHLVECNNVHGVCVPALRGGFCCHPKPNGQVSHAVHNHTLVPEEGKELRDQMFKTAYFGVFSVILPNPLFMI